MSESGANLPKDPLDAGVVGVNNLEFPPLVTTKPSNPDSSSNQNSALKSVPLRLSDSGSRMPEFGANLSKDPLDAGVVGKGDSQGSEMEERIISENQSVPVHVSAPVHVSTPVHVSAPVHLSMPEHVQVENSRRTVAQGYTLEEGMVSETHPQGKGNLSLEDPLQINEGMVLEGQLYKGKKKL
ncbi:uncharacterized protein A4U43_C01F11890 [Asparagus officinalis]|uniref:Uncharacterized protein n=1 Tax=Asparagus officinalis TaxID=4686 RepID=A0A5P1FNN2_ASPOF|nr:uncharacterized protein A4U43_C01F11890 [Asparagus officinalis]